MRAGLSESTKEEISLHREEIGGENLYDNTIAVTPDIPTNTYNYDNTYTSTDMSLPANPTTPNPETGIHLPISNETAAIDQPTGSADLPVDRRSAVRGRLTTPFVARLRVNRQVDRSECRNLIGDMAKRCQEVIANNGHQIDR